MNSHKISSWLALASFTLAAASFAPGATYYVDSVAGNDNNAGTVQSAPWQTLTKVDATTFQPGDQILFLCGDVWTGVLSPLGSGSNGSPIVIGNYGTGALPLIQGNGVTGGAVSLYNQDYWEISNLQVTNSASTAGERNGINVSASNFGLVSYIHIVGCTIDNVTGTVGQQLTDKRTGGIYIGVTADNTTATRYDNVLVTGCTIHDCSNQGIVTDNWDVSLSGSTDMTNYPGSSGWTARHFSNVTISNNLIYNITKNAIIVRLTDNTGLIENNVCHDTATALSGNTIYTVCSSGTVFQYNEGYNNLTPIVQDGDMYDSDLSSTGSVWQYSYSHNNNFGLIMFDTNTSDTGMVVRYNISQNDKGGGGGIIYINYPFTSASIYNNDIYVGSGMNSNIILSNTANHHTYSFSNNIVDNASTSAAYSLNSGDNATYSHNLFYGNHPASEPADSSKLTSNPLFVSAGSGGNGLTTVSGYQLEAGSPAIGSGVLIANNGGLDYWGNAVSATAAPNRGAYNGAGVGSGSVAAPVFSPAAGTYSTAQSVSISDTTPGASIYYTINGSTPTSTTGTLYSGPVAISAATTLQAIASLSGVSSSVTSGTYSIAQSQSSTQLIAINCGGPAVSPFVADEDFTGGATLNHANTINTSEVTNPAPAAVYQSGRDGATQASGVGATFSYTIGGFTAGTNYLVRLHFAETYFTTKGSRVFNVTINGTQVLTNFDIVATSGGENIANIQQFTEPANASGQFVITFVSVTNNALISGIEIDSTTPPPPPLPAAPSFSPAPGSYSSAQSVTISDTTAGASIYYTTDGSTPTTSSNLYAGPVAIAATTTLNAIASNSNGSSSVTSGTYTITPPAAPSFSPAPGSYASAQTVTISDTTAGALIFYTTDGSTPTVSSNLYTGPVAIAATTTLNAIASNDIGSSSVTSGTYTITPPAAPSFSPAPGSYSSAQSVTISDTTAGASIYYTTDGSTPTVSSNLYTGPVAIAATTTLNAIASDSVGSSSVTSGTYTITPAAAPSFSPAPGSYASAQTVTISDATAGASIYYTTDGSTPTVSSNLYTGPVAIAATTTLEAIASDSVGSSSVTSGTYTITPPAAPSFSPAPGSYSSAQSVSMSSSSGASIYYTTDGSTPTTSSTLYSGPVAVSATMTLNAIASNSVGSGSMMSGTYTVNRAKITLQASSLAPTGSGQGLSDNTDANAPGGTYEKITSTAVGQYIQFTTPSIAAGTYSLSFIYRSNPTRAQHNVTIDGKQVGTTTVDQYAATATYPAAVTIGSVTFATAGTHTIRLTVTGHNAASTSYDMAAVQFIFQ